jgi:hypothetical protein
LDGRLYLRNGKAPENVRLEMAETLRQSGYHEVKIRTGGGLIANCEVLINGQPVPMAVDTGANVTGIDDNIAALVGLKPKSRHMKMSGLDDVGTHEMRLARATTFQVGDILNEKFTLGVTQFEYWHIAEESRSELELQGLLGADYLGENQALIDFRHKRMWLRPPEKKPKLKE